MIPWMQFLRRADPTDFRYRTRCCIPHGPCTAYAPSLAREDNLRSPPIRVHHAGVRVPPRDTIRPPIQVHHAGAPVRFPCIRVSLEIEFFMLAHQPVRNSNSSSSSCQRTGTCQRKRIRNSSSSLAHQLQLEKTIRVPPILDSK